jgi:hypothetical protein
MTSTYSSVALTRDRLCVVAGIERARHRRWSGEGILRSRPPYRELDVVRAAVFDELWTRLGPKRARSAWQQVARDLEMPSGRLEVVFDLNVDAATVARTADELDSALRRGVPTMVIDLGARVERARSELRTYLGNTTMPDRGSGEPRDVSAVEADAR